MSNLFEMFLDKLIFSPVSVKDPPLSKTFSGSQNLVGSNVNMDSTVISEFHQLLNPDCHFPNHMTMGVFTGVKNTIPYFDTSNSLVRRVSKVFLPPLVPLQELPIVSTQAECLLAPESIFTRRVSILSEIIDQIDMFINKGYNVEKPLKSRDMLCNSMQIEVLQAPAVVTENKKADMDSIPLPKVVKKPKIPTKASNSQIMNQEFVNRKTQKLHKQSKKRRRRQKKNEAKATPKVAKESTPFDQKKINRTDASQNTNHRTLADGDAFCDIISVTGQILPDVTSFVISVESVVDDDSDWDACSDSDWLDDCSEFQMTGLFVGNFTTPTVRKAASHLEVPQEDKESLQLRMLLRNVNKAWEEANKDLKEQKRTSKVSFAREEVLVEVREVDTYDRKGEWEIYYHERVRFKKRIEDLENVISPCLTKEHRQKVFENLQKYVL